MTKPSYINDEGINPSQQAHNGTVLTQCPVFLVQGMPWSTVTGILRPGYAWQVSLNCHFESTVTIQLQLLQLQLTYSDNNVSAFTVGDSIQLSSVVYSCC
jgi:hypothetical protein